MKDGHAEGTFSRGRIAEGGSGENTVSGGLHDETIEASRVHTHALTEEAKA